MFSSMLAAVAAHIAVIWTGSIQAMEDFTNHLQTLAEDEFLHVRERVAGLLHRIENEATRRGITEPAASGAANADAAVGLAAEKAEQLAGDAVGRAEARVLTFVEDLATEIYDKIEPALGIHEEDKVRADIASIIKDTVREE